MSRDDLKVTVLGCGPSPGVPMIGGKWGACDPHNPKNQRTRSSVLVETKGKKILIDTSPDVRQQFLRENIGHIDAILYTHGHADHIYGLSDVYSLARFSDYYIPVYADPLTLQEVQTSFAYAFWQEGSKNEYYKPRLIPHEIKTPTFEILEGLSVQHFEQDHGFTKTYGYRMGAFAYSTDLIGMPESSWKVLEGIDTWVVSCLRLMPHETHGHLDLVLEWIERLQPRRAYLTHMESSLDYEQLCAMLPAHVAPCYDGLKIDVNP